MLKPGLSVYLAMLRQRLSQPAGPRRPWRSGLRARTSFDLPLLFEFRAVSTPRLGRTFRNTPFFRRRSRYFLLRGRRATAEKMPRNALVHALRTGLRRSSKNKGKESQQDRK